MAYDRIDPAAIRVRPLSDRNALIQIEQAACDPSASPPELTNDQLRASIDRLVQQMRSARQAGRSIMITYGAHLVKNGAGPLLNALIEDGWVTHLATQGAGIIHDWEFAFQGHSSESVADNAPVGRFGIWDETGRWLNRAAVEGRARDEGWGESLGRLINDNPADHPYRRYSITATAHSRRVPLCVMPGIGYDIYCCHPSFNGGAIGEVAQRALPMLCILLACTFVWDAARRRFGSWQALAVLVMLLANMNQHYFAHVARPYAVLSLFVAALVWVLSNDDLSKRTRFISIAVCIALLMYTHYSAAAAVIGLALLAVARPKPQWRQLAAIGVGIVAWLPWLVFCIFNAKPVGDNLGWIQEANWANAATSITRFTFNENVHDFAVQHPSISFVLYVAPVVAAALAIYGGVRSGEFGRLMLWLWVGPILMGLGAIFTGDRDLFMTERYFTAAILAQTTLITLAFIHPPTFLSKLRVPLTVALVAFVCVTFFTSLQDPRHPNNAREMAAHLDARMATNEFAVTIYTNQPFDWYHRKPFATLLDSDAIANPNIQAKPAPADLLTAKTTGIWLVFNRGDWQRHESNALEPDEFLSRYYPEAGKGHWRRCVREGLNSPAMIRADLQAEQRSQAGR